jgi:hypothetical protein
MANDNPHLWQQSQTAISLCFDEWRQYAVAAHQIRRRAFDFHAAIEDGKVAQLRPELATVAGQSRVIDNARAVLPLYGIDADWFYEQWCMSPALRDHRATLFFVDAFAAMAKRMPRQKPKAAAQDDETLPPSAAEVISDQAEWSRFQDHDIESILGAA